MDTEGGLFKRRTAVQKELNFLIFRDGAWWVAQCIEHDIAVQAQSLQEIESEIQRVINGRIAIAKELRIDPFEGLPSAPEEYHRICPNYLYKVIKENGGVENEDHS